MSNTPDLRYRFDELVTTIRLLPDVETDGGNISGDGPDWLFPNGTRDLAEPEIYSALLCQTMRGDQEFQYKMAGTLSNTCFKSVKDKVEAGNMPDNNDMYALAIAANILWAAGQSGPLFTTLGIMGGLSSAFDIKIPDLGTVFLKGNTGMERFGELDPYELLEGKINGQDIDTLFSNREDE